MLPSLAAWLSHEDRHVRGNAAFISGGLGDPRGFQVITDISTDQSNRPRGVITGGNWKAPDSGRPLSCRPSDGRPSRSASGPDFGGAAKGRGSQLDSAMGARTNRRQRRGGPSTRCSRRRQSIDPCSLDLCALNAECGRGAPSIDLAVGRSPEVQFRCPGLGRRSRRDGDCEAPVIR